jgi:hypothetical protein
MATPAVGMMGAGMGLGAIGALSSGLSNSANMQAQANAYNYNAEIQKQQAQVAGEAATSNAAAEYRQSQQAIGEERASLSQAGGGWNGTATNVLNQSAVNSEIARQNTLYNGAVQANNYNAQAQMTQWQGNVAQANVNQGMFAGILGAGANLMGGQGYRSSGGLAGMFPNAFNSW